MLLELIKAAALLLALSLLQGFIVRFWQENKILAQVLSGGLFGGICVIGMMLPIEVTPGVIFDPRSVVLASAGLFGGSIVAGIAAVIAGGYRIWLGGGGAPVGVAVVIVCTALGLAYRYGQHRGWLKVNFQYLLLFGLIVHIVEVLLFTQLPAEAVQKVMDTVALPLILTFTPATAFLGMLLLDIQKRVKTESDLVASEEKYRLINSRIPGILYQFKVDINGNMSLPYVSPTVENYIGLSAEVVMNDVGVWKAQTHPDDLAGLETSIAESIKNMTPWEWEGRFTCHETDMCWLHGSSTPEKQDDGSVIWDGVFADITERKRAEEALSKKEAHMHAIVNSVPDAFIFVNTERKIISINPAAKNLFGYSDEELMGEITEILYADSADYKNMGKTRYNKEAGNFDEPYFLKYRRRDGTEFSGETVGTKVIDDKGKVLGFIGIIRDVSGRLAIEDELSRHRETLEYLVDERTKELKIARDEAERSNQAKTEFLSKMSHELRTPMNAIIGFSQILEMNLEDESHKSHIGEVIAAARHLLELINEVLDLSTIEAGMLNISLEDVSLNTVLDECLSLTKPLAAKANIQIINNLNPADNYTIRVDHTRFKQVILNLLSNAIKYNNDNGTVTLSCNVIDANHLRINVSDTGNGLTEQQQQRLFKPFERMAEHKGIDGTGIGLVITKQLIEMMDGMVGVESQPGQGSTFWVQVNLSEM